MFQSKVIHRPGFCTVFSNGIQKRKPKFCHVLIVAQVCLWSGSSRHLTTASSCMQTHTQPGHVRTVAYTKSDLPSRLGYKWAHTSGPTEGIPGLAHRSAECCPTSCLASCCPHAPTSRLPTGGLILPPAAEGAMPTGTRLKVATQEPLCVSVLFSAHCFLFLFKLKYKCKMCRKRECQTQ